MKSRVMLPSPDILNEFEGGKFILSNLAARRAQALAQGAVPLVEIESRHPLTIALAEIAAGKIKPILPNDIAAALAEPDEPTSVLDVSSDRGILLPGLDDADSDLLGDEMDLENDAEAEMLDDDSLSLSDLGPAEDENMGGEAVQGGEAEDEISLSELGDEEAAAEGSDDDD